MIDVRAWQTRRRLLAAGGVVVIAAVLTLALALRVGAAPACAAPAQAVLAGPQPVLAAPPTGNTVHQGRSTFYDSQGSGGNCSFVGAPADRLYVALGPSEYAAGAACGGYLQVTGPKGQVRVLVMDRCPECEPGHLDLSAEAFAAIADPVQGVVAVTYRAVVDPPLTGPLTFRMKEGTSSWWFAVLIGGHGNPLRSVEARTSGAWRTAARQDYNYWVIDGGMGTGPYDLRVTDVYGHQVVATSIRLAPGQTQRSTVRMYGVAGAVNPAGAASTARPTPAPAVAAAPASGSADTTSTPRAPSTPSTSDASADPGLAGRSQPTDTCVHSGR